MLIFYGHPFSSYTWKALIALYEKGIDFDYRPLETEAPFTHYDELRAHWPVGQFPLIVDDGVPIFESSIIIEYLDQKIPDPQLIPADPRMALDVRFLDRIFDNHFQARFQAVVAEYLPFITENPILPASSAHATCSKKPMAGSRPSCPPTAGRRRTAFRWRTAPPRRRSSMPTGFIRSIRAMPGCAPIVRV